VGTSTYTQAPPLWRGGALPIRIYQSSIRFLKARMDKPPLPHNPVHSRQPGPVITVSGPHGTGKSTYALALAEALRLRYVSAGKLFRDLAKERGISLEALGEIAATNPAVDRMIDERTKLEAQKGGVVIDAQLGAWMVKEIADVKVLVLASDEVRFKRISQRDRVSQTEARKQTMARETIQVRRYKKYYGVDVTDTSIYDLRVDTSIYPIEKAKTIIIEGVQRLLSRNQLTGAAFG